SDFHSDSSSDSSSRHSLSDHSSPDLPSTFAGPSRKRRRSPMTYVSALLLVSGALSHVRADLIPSPKRVKDSSYLADVEVDPREISLRDDAIVRVSDEPHLEQDIDPEIQAEIDECIAYADALRDRGIDARVVIEAVDQDETETGVRGPVEVRVERITHPAMPKDIPKPAQEGAVEVMYKTLGDLVQRFHDHTQAIPVHRIHVIEEVQREKRVGPLPTHRLVVRHSADHSSSDSSSKASSDFHSDASSDSSSRHSLSNHSSPELLSTFAGPSSKRRRSPMASVPALPLISEALSLVRANLVPSPKRVMDSGYLADVEVDPSEVRLGINVEDESFEQSGSRGTDLEVDDDVERSEEPHSEPEIDPVEAVIEACFDFADIIRASRVDVRVEAVTVARDDVEMSVRDPIMVSDDGDTPPVVPEVIPEHAQKERAIEGTYETLGDLVQRFHDHTE
ncbi:hypothetical protein Tco_1530068, partial [Tanacetum coccineum]